MSSAVRAQRGSRCITRRQRWGVFTDAASSCDRTLPHVAHDARSSLAFNASAVFGGFGLLPGKADSPYRYLLARVVLHDPQFPQSSPPKSLAPAAPREHIMEHLGKWEFIFFSVFLSCRFLIKRCCGWIGGKNPAIPWVETPKCTPHGPHCAKRGSERKGTAAATARPPAHLANCHVDRLRN